MPTEKKVMSATSPSALSVCLPLTNRDSVE